MLTNRGEIHDSEAGRISPGRRADSDFDLAAEFG
jgi:hypothetical protein